MIALLLALQVPDPLPAPLGRQALPARGCAAYLWSRGPTPALVAMATADPATLRLALGGKPADYPRIAASGAAAGYGLAARTEYRLGGVTATLDLTLAARADLTQGAAVTDATLTIVRDGAETLVLPVGGLVGCRTAS